MSRWAMPHGNALSFTLSARRSTTRMAVPRQWPRIWQEWAYVGRDRHAQRAGSTAISMHRSISGATRRGTHCDHLIPATGRVVPSEWRTLTRGAESRRGTQIGNPGAGAVPDRAC